MKKTINFAHVLATIKCLFFCKRRIFILNPWLLLKVTKTQNVNCQTFLSVSILKVGWWPVGKEN